MRMKPLPKAIIVIAIVGGIGYGVSQYMDYRKANPPAEAAQAVPTPTPAAAPVAAAPQPEPVQPAAAPTATTTNQNDRGLNNLFK